MPKTYIRESNLSSLSNYLIVAAERFAENAKVLDGAPGHKALADQFREQERDARKFANLFMLAEPFTLDHDEDEDDAETA